MITISWNYPNVCSFGKISIKIVYLREEHFTWREFDRHCSDTVHSLLFVPMYSFNMVTLSARSLRHEDKIGQFVWRRIRMPLSKHPLVTLNSNVSNSRSPNVSALKAYFLLNSKWAHKPHLSINWKGFTMKLQCTCDVLNLSSDSICQ